MEFVQAIRAGVSGVNWFAVFWLVFLANPVMDFFAVPRGTAATAAFLAAIAAYVVLYYAALDFQGSHPDAKARPIYVGVAASFVMAAALAPSISVDSSWTFFVYAAAFAGFQPSRTFALAVVAVIATISVAAFAVGQLTLLSLGFVVLLSSAIAVGNGYFYRWLAASRRLQEAQAEVARVAKIAERERIARDLHDLLGHTLSVIVLKSELASRLAETDPARATNEIRDVERISREALAEVRAAVRGYRTTGLSAELAGASLALEAAGVRLEHYAEPVDLDPSQEAVLAFVLREAVTNLVRHARATTCRIAVERVGRDVRLTVQDDGQGGAIADGNGLRGMRDRLNTAGGRLDVESRKGTKVVATLPAQNTALGDDASFHPAAASPVRS
jgi:two-component system sensor histidine kinase DesK